LWLKHYLVTKLLQPLDEVFRALLFIQAIEVITTQFFVYDTFLQDVPGRLQDRPRHRDDCPFLSSPRRQSPIYCGHITIFFVRRSPRRLDQGSLQPLITLRRFAATLLASRFVLARAQCSPTYQIIIGREWSHIRTNLGQNIFGAPQSDSADRVESFKLSLVGRHQFFNSLTVAFDLLIQNPNLFQHAPAHPQLILVELSVERLDQWLVVGFESPSRQCRQTRRIALAFAHRLDHLPATHSHNV